MMIHRRTGRRLDPGIGWRSHVWIVAVQVRLGIIARFDLSAGKDGRNLVGRGVVAILIPSDNEQTVVRRRPRQISIDDVRLQPGIRLLNRSVVHVVLLVWNDERDGGQISKTSRT